MNEGQKSARAYQALLEVADELDASGKPSSADRLIGCIDELGEASLARLFDIMEAAVAKVKA
jgi:hypothetical protein